MPQVSNPIERALQDARRQRNEGRSSEAEQAYAKAAELARSANDQRALAHALRHLSDLVRARGALETASRHASEAAALYRRSDDSLGLANAIRLQALAATDPGAARSLWAKARDLYSRLGIDAGVAECDCRLGE